MSQRAIFLDKDGTLIVNVPYNVDPDKIALMPGAAALKALQTAGYKLVLISNQAGVAHGYFEESALSAVWQRIKELLAPAGITIEAAYYCPHHPQAERADYRCRCECRKPEPGLLHRAARELKIDLSQSWFLGDILDDVQAGNRAGCRSILIDVGSETEWHINAERLPDYQVSDLDEAVETVLFCDNQSLESLQLSFPGYLPVDLSPD